MGPRNKRDLGFEEVYDAVDEAAKLRSIIPTRAMLGYELDIQRTCNLWSLLIEQITSQFRDQAQTHLWVKLSMELS